MFGRGAAPVRSHPTKLSLGGRFANRSSMRSLGLRASAPRARANHRKENPFQSGNPEHENVNAWATRDTPQCRVTVAQRDALFKRLVIGENQAVFNPVWGDHAVSFAKGGWVSGEAFGLGTPVATGTGSSIAATAGSRSKKDVDVGFDLAFASLLARDVERGTPPSNEQLSMFAAAVRYREERADESAFAPTEIDTQFAETLKAE
jgi:hypothetical protein